MYNHLPTRIRASVDPNVINSASRLFNATLEDILNELLQNARRGDATRVDVCVLEDNSSYHITIADNGCGIENPQSLLCLGKSDWGNELCASETPAGMGVFSLANCGATIRSRHATSLKGWELELAPEHFRGTEYAEAIPMDTEPGTTISFRTKCNPYNTIVMVSEFYPCEVYLDGKPVKQSGFMDGALLVEEWGGVRLGVFKPPLHKANNFQWNSINFFGIVAKFNFPTICSDYSNYVVRVDVVDCPDLHLVLPARREPVSNAFLEELSIRAKTLLYRYISVLPFHTLSFKEYEEANSMGIELVEAKAALQPWDPLIAGEPRFPRDGQPVSANTVILDETNLEAPESQSLQRALSLSELDISLTVAKEEYRGYSWYDALAVLHFDEIIVDVEDNHFQSKLDEFHQSYDFSCTSADRITLLGHYAYSDDTERRINVNADILLVSKDDMDAFAYCPPIVSKSTDITVDEFVNIMVEAYFDPGQWSGPHDFDGLLEEFTDSVTQHAVKVLRSEHEAIIAVLERIVHREVSFHVPTGSKATITLEGSKISVALTPIAEAA